MEDVATRHCTAKGGGKPPVDSYLGDDRRTQGSHREDPGRGSGGVGRERAVDSAPGFSVPGGATNSKRLYSEGLGSVVVCNFGGTHAAGAA